ncbi:ATP-binding protein [Nocardioides mesophilus]|uniref:histidine kinase n=1 Tax=Nocardioides mesophilus TaxID=433659 RepID=A0A7G9RCH9_9ACTN|nr:ATP-binding protein [Nocardioides mesophilus]QNN53304.1 sensor histidine kinase [Nocardioides mesophilus]
MSEPIYTLELREERDVFAARQAGREVAAAVGLDDLDQVRIATALSEVSRDVVAAGGGDVTFSVRTPDLFFVELVTSGQEPALRRQQADTGGVDAARRLVDTVTLTTDPDGHAVLTLVKQVMRVVELGDKARTELQQRVSSTMWRDPLDELRAQNRELVTALEEVRARRDELVSVNKELEETNRGVVALYEELSGELETTNQGVVALYAEIDDKNRRLREASEAKTRFLRYISHELRTPGNSVLGLARLLLDKSADPLTEEQRQQIFFIETSARDLIRLVNDLLDLAKAESGRIEPRWQEVDLRALFDDLRGTIAPLVADGVDLVVEDPSPVGPIRSDPTLLGHVLRNLLSNAANFTLVGEVRLSTERDGSAVRFTVHDTGIGIAEEDRTHVFEEFFQVRTPPRAGGRGSGLGLPFARRVALILGGDVRLSGTPVGGSTFVVEVPVHGPPDAAPREDPEP